MIKISKKMCLLMMCMALVILTVPQASAETGRYFKESFDLEKDVTISKNYPGSGTDSSGGSVTVTSDIFTASDQMNVTIDADAGRDGAGALILSQKASNSVTSMPIRTDFVSNLAAGDRVIFKYDVKFAALADVIESSYTKTINLSSTNGNSGGYTVGLSKATGESAYFFAGSVTNVGVDTTKWYTIVNEMDIATLERDGEGAVTSVNLTRTTTIYDDNGTYLVSNTKTVTSAGYLNFFGPKLWQGSYGSVLHMDNASLLIYNPEDRPELISSNMTDGETDVLRNKELKFTFSQPIESAPVLYLDGEAVSSVNVTIDANEVSLSLPEDSLLDKKAIYTIDFSGVTNSGGNTCTASTISFTTEGTNLLNDVAVGSAVLSSGSVTAEFTLTDPHGYPTFNGYVIAASYDASGILKDFATQALNCQVGETVSKTFTLSAVAGDSLQLMLFDTTEGISPLASGECSISAAE